MIYLVHMTLCRYMNKCAIVLQKYIRGYLGRKAFFFQVKVHVLYIIVLSTVTHGYIHFDEHFTVPTGVL